MWGASTSDRSEDETDSLSNGGSGAACWEDACRRGEFAASVPKPGAAAGISTPARASVDTAALCASDTVSDGGGVVYWQCRAVRILPTASGVSAGIFRRRGIVSAGSFLSDVTPSRPVTVALGLRGCVWFASVGERDASEPTMPVGDRGATEPRGGIVCALVSALVAAGLDTFSCLCAC